MKDWGKELYKEWVEEKLIPDLLGEVCRYTGYEGNFNINYKSKYTLNPTPEMVARKKGDSWKTEIRIKRPELSTNTPWDVFFYGWSLIGEALHAADVSNNGKPTLSERVVHLNAFYMMKRYMRNNYRSWYRANRRVFEAMTRVLTFTPVD